MRLRTLGCLSALLTLSLTAQSLTAQAETKTKPAKSGVTQSQEIAAGDLALGKTVPTTPTPTAAPPDTADNRYVYSPGLAAASEAPPKPVASPAPEPMPEADVRTDLPKRLPYREEQSMPGYVLQEHKRWWMVGVGGAMFALGYVVGLGVAGDRDFDNGLGFAAIPIAGPWVALAMHDDCTEDEAVISSSSDVSCNEESIQAGLVASGVMQTGGAALLALALGSTRQVWVREDLAVQVTPLVGRNANGLSLRGTF